MAKYKKIDDVNNISILLLSHMNSKDKYSLGPFIKSSNNEKVFPFLQSEELLFFPKETDLDFWFVKSQPITTCPTMGKKYIEETTVLSVNYTPLNNWVFKL